LDPSHSCSLGSEAAGASCRTCPPGKFSSSGTCTNCSYGRYSALSGSSSCLDCPKNFYADTVGSSTCIECPKPSYIQSTGASSISACKIQNCSNWISISDQFGTQYLKSFSSSTITSFWMAQDFCQSQGHGAHLMYPRSSIMLNFMSSNTSSTYWLGMYSLTGSPASNLTTSFYWADHSPALGNDSLVNVLSRQTFSNSMYVGCSKFSKLSSTQFQVTDCLDQSLRTFWCQIEQEFCSAFCSIPGTFLNTSSGFPYSCDQCPTGKFQKFSGANSIACDYCNPGLFSNYTGASFCETCPAGFFSNSSGRSLCEQCNVGTFMKDLGSTFCTFCPIGFYSGHYGQNKCSACPGGTIGPMSGLSSCTPCSIGLFSNGSQLHKCQVCPSGRFANETGASACRDCGFMADTQGEGSISASQCICSSGYFGNASFDRCQACPNGVAFTCPSGSLIPWINPGFFRIDSDSVFECTPSVACSKTEDSLTTTCGIGYTGYVCGECDENFYKSSLECKPCPSQVSKVLTILGGILVFLIMMTRLLGSRTKVSTDLRITFQAIQIVALFPNITVKWPAFLLSIFHWLSFIVCSLLCSFRLTLNCRTLTLNFSLQNVQSKPPSGESII
jgi:hypothetical protein